MASLLLNTISRRCLSRWSASLLSPATTSFSSSSSASQKSGPTRERKNLGLKLELSGDAKKESVEPDEDSESDIITTGQDPPKSFPTLLRNSTLMQLGDPSGRLVVGRIFHIVQDDLYIDFGWKFHCVCRRPTKNAASFVRGAKVRLRIHDLEISTRFLGAPRDMTLNEADCTLVGLQWSPTREWESGPRNPNQITIDEPEEPLTTNIASSIIK